ncbi:hypothetical protein N7456_000962 [Penicillium angulare]|uniref:Tat pathway signal sequence protein n=1 Tax=Penicillium angulare TaxID=116970 RepID=A0A9W9KSQ7_9EURO|nr:hypothetical protein N7456_000962 [Penicillium angulare]
MRQSVHADPAFEAPPNRTEGTEPVWDSLIPDGLGYVKNPELAPNLSVIGAFHQLHCLYIVRRAYYDNEPSDLHHSRRSDFDVGVDRHPHVGHCFDYLRQSLQCASDSHLEPVGERVVGNPSWGFDRQCRDFEGLKAWAEEWAAVDIPGTFIPDIFKSHHH